jgi:hypothetical protein
LGGGGRMHVWKSDEGRTEVGSSVVVEEEEEEEE